MIAFEVFSNQNCKR